MKYLVRQAKVLVYFLLIFVIIYTLSLTITTPVLSPTMEINILGSTESESTDLENFVSYQLSSPSYDTKLRAAGYAVLNLHTDSILTKSHSDIPLPIASLTKLMTAWVTLKYGSLNDSYIVRSSDLEPTSPSLNLQVGDEIKVQDLLNAMLIGSNNDAAKALAGYIEQKTNLKFTNLMNQEAKNLKMNNSRYSNSIGFDSNTNYSSVDDIAILVQALLPTQIFEQTNRQSSYQFKSLSEHTYTTTATNKLIATYPDLHAIKTGFTNTALGSMVNLLTYHDQTYLLIVVGSSDREADTLELRNLVIKQ